MSSCLGKTDLKVDGLKKIYEGKVREIYEYGDRLVMVATDRISAFDHILPEPIPYKGQVLNKVAEYFLNACKDIVPIWLEESPHPNVAIGKRCEPIKLEMVIRGYLTGHAWRTYKSGLRELCGVALPEDMKEHDRFPQPIITPATKADEGHDEDISKEDILAQGIVTQNQWDQLEQYTRALYQKGTDMAREQGLILVDTKYEFGLYNGEIMLMDEIHTPDSSRYFYAEGYEERQANGEAQQQLSKEFVREWLMEYGFQGLEGQVMPDMPAEFVQTVSDRYIQLYEIVTGRFFHRNQTDDLHGELEEVMRGYVG